MSIIEKIKNFLFSKKQVKKVEKLDLKGIEK